MLVLLFVVCLIVLSINKYYILLDFTNICKS